MGRKEVLRIFIWMCLSKFARHQREWPWLISSGDIVNGQEIVMRYMEKHEIFQLFLQITETLLSEQPDDPLKNILEQVQELINKREIAEKHHQN
uniref:Uncharacterized protein n=2 Tax=Eptatretus burgeri TaxID=7764 RepID=A0A8C4Q4D2_EPTBU